VTDPWRSSQVRCEITPVTEQRSHISEREHKSRAALREVIFDAAARDQATSRPSCRSASIEPSHPRPQTRTTTHARLSISCWIGNDRMRLPVAAKIALHTAGAIGGTPGSPTPVGFSFEGTMCTSTFGISFILSTG
jgi:hypothetical protein